MRGVLKIEFTDNSSLYVDLTDYCMVSVNNDGIVLHRGGRRKPIHIDTKEISNHSFIENIYDEKNTPIKGFA